MAKVLLLIAIYLSGLTFAEEEADSQEVDDEDYNKNLRLPQVVSPNHYQLTLLPILDKKPRLCGHVWIKASIQAPTKAVVLNAFQIIPLEIVVVSADSVSNISETRRKVEEACFLGGLDFDDDNREEKKTKMSDLVEDLHLDYDNQHLVIILKDVLPVGHVYWIGIHYHAEIYDNDNIGFFRVENKLNKNDCCEK